MIITFELIREASVRMPRPIGQTIGIIGAVVLGEAAVTAGIASAPMIVVTAITALSTFLAPALSRTDNSDSNHYFDYGKFYGNIRYWFHSGGILLFIYAG